jgi:VWFA-related protein
MPRTIIRLLFFLTVTAGLTAAQESLYTLRVDVPLVSVDVAVRDPSGSPVNDLLKEDFEIYEDGEVQEIQYFSPATSPYSVLLLFDGSGSIQHKWDFMQRAILGFIANLRPQDRVAIGTFGYELQMHVRWNDSRRKAVDSLPNLISVKPAGGTDLYRSLERALSREFKDVTSRRAVVVLTDGRDTSLYLQLVSRNRLSNPASDREFQKALRVARQSRIPIYFAAINTDRNLEPNTVGGDEYRNLKAIFPNSNVPTQFLAEVRTRMEHLADVSSGSVLYPREIAEIVSMYERIGRELGMSYSLGYVSSRPEANGVIRRIEVRTRRTGLQTSQSRASYTAR